MFTLSTTSAVEMADLSAIELPARDDVSFMWRGVRHGDLASAIICGCNSRGLEVMRAQWGVNRSGSDLFGCIDLLPREDTGLVAAAGTGFALGIRHSNMGKYAVTFAVGARVFVCENGMMVGDFLLKHKHTIMLNLDEMIGLAVDQYLREARAVTASIERLQALSLTDAQAAQAILSAVTFDEMPGRFAPAVWAQWLEPTYADFLPRTGWSLHNAFTQTAKDMALPTQYTLMRALPHRIAARGNVFFDGRLSGVGGGQIIIDDPVLPLEMEDVNE